MSEEREDALFTASAPHSPAGAAAERPSSARQDASPDPDNSPGASPLAAAEELAAIRRSLQQVELLLGHIRAQSDPRTRHPRQEPFSPARLVGALLEVCVVGLLIAAAADWAFERSEVSLLLKLVFAGVVQMGALTAFLVGR